MRDVGSELGLVDADDVAVGTCGKLETHRRGLRHRAFSVFIKDRRGHLLLQRRAAGKYHSPGLWANTCCGHPGPGEDVALAARRRLGEEMGFDCALRAVGRHAYRADVGNDLVEDEVVHLFVGQYDGEFVPNPEEVAEFAWLTLDELSAEAAHDRSRYAAWLLDYLDTLGDEIDTWI